jgi:hypothetical protein
VKTLEDIYNTYLRVQRTKKNLPFKLRKDFSDIQSHRHYATLLKLENFFKRNSYVNLNDFFSAPYELYKDEKHFDLDFYLSQKAVKVYTLYQKKKIYLDPDSEIQIECVLEGLRFIYKFCKENEIKLKDYLEHMTNGMHTVFVHLKQKNVSIYNCLAFNNFQSTVNKENFQVLEFMLGEIISRLPIFRTKFYSSKVCKNTSLNGLKIIEKKLLQSQKNKIS